MSLGKTLRTAREAKGITSSELASRTHLLVQIVEGLENEDFRRIPAPIYGRGFIKLYCEAVGLDPKPLMAEFSALYSTAKDPQQAQKPSSSTSPSPRAPATSPQSAPSLSNPKTHDEKTPISAPSNDPGAENIPPKVTENLFPSLSDVEPAPKAGSAPIPNPTPKSDEGEQPPLPKVIANLEKAKPSIPSPECTSAPKNILESATASSPRRSYGELFEQTYAENEPAKPSAAEKFRDTMSNVSHGVFANVKKLPPNTGRMVAVGIVALLLLAIIGWGVFVLYKATSPQPEAKQPVQQQSSETEKNSPRQPAAKPDLTDQKTTGKTATKVSAKTAELKVSGIDIPALYID